MASADVPPPLPGYDPTENLRLIDREGSITKSAGGTEAASTARKESARKDLSTRVSNTFGGLTKIKIPGAAKVASFFATKLQSVRSAFTRPPPAALPSTPMPTLERRVSQTSLKTPLSETPPPQSTTLVRSAAQTSFRALTPTLSRESTISTVALAKEYESVVLGNLLKERDPPLTERELTKELRDTIEQSLMNHPEYAGKSHEHTLEEKAAGILHAILENYAKENDPEEVRGMIVLNAQLMKDMTFEKFSDIVNKYYKEITNIEEFMDQAPDMAPELKSLILICKTRTQEEKDVFFMEDKITALQSEVKKLKGEGGEALAKARDDLGRCLEFRKLSEGEMYKNRFSQLSEKFLLMKMKAIEDLNLNNTIELLKEGTSFRHLQSEIQCMDQAVRDMRFYPSPKTKEEERVYKEFVEASKQYRLDKVSIGGGLEGRGRESSQESNRMKSLKAKAEYFILRRGQDNIENQMKSKFDAFAKKTAKKDDVMLMKATLTQGGYVGEMLGLKSLESLHDVYDLSLLAASVQRRSEKPDSYQAATAALCEKQLEQVSNPKQGEDLEVFYTATAKDLDESLTLLELIKTCEKEPGVLKSILATAPENVLEWTDQHRLVERAQRLFDLGVRGQDVEAINNKMISIFAKKKQSQLAPLFEKSPRVKIVVQKAVQEEQQRMEQQEQDQLKKNKLKNKQV